MNGRGKMDPAEDSDKGPVMFLLGVIVVGVLTLVLCANLLRKPPETNPFDAPATAAEPAAPVQ